MNKNKENSYESMVKAINKIKPSLKNCIDIVITSSKGSSTGFIATGKNKKDILYFNKNTDTISFNKKQILNNVKDFFMHFYEDTNAVLYRINVNDKQIRGYIYLGNLDSFKGEVN